MVKEGIISEEDREIYLFGMKELISQIFAYSVMFEIGFAFGMLMETIVFIIVYMSLRVYAGGYHAPSQLACYILSFGMVIAALLLIRWLSVSEVVIVVSIVLMGGMIYSMAPSEHKNKPLSENEKKIYKKKVGQRVIANILFSLAVAITGMTEILTAMGAALFFLAFMMVCNCEKLKRLFVIARS